MNPGELFLCIGKMFWMCEQPAEVKTQEGYMSRHMCPWTYVRQTEYSENESLRI